MTYDGWLSFGGNEIVNSERARSVAENAACPMGWFRGDRCAGLAGATGSEASSYADVTTAPWYDPALPDVSSRFYGSYGVSVKGIPDATDTSTVTESVGPGGTIGSSRAATRRVVVRAVLAGRGADAIDYGMSWLKSSLRAGACGQHAAECGLTDLEFWTSCPPERAWLTEPDPDYIFILPAPLTGLALLTAGGPDLSLGEDEGIYERGVQSRLVETESEGLSVLVGAEPSPVLIRRQQTDEEYAATLVEYQRYLHDVGRISGPLVLEEYESRGFNAYVVEFVIAAERPWVFSRTVEANLPPSLPVVVQDIAYNLAKYPSAELEGPEVIVARNYSPNPSVETNSDTWSAVAEAVSGTDPATYFTSGRTTELAAVGLASFRGVLTGTGSGAGRARITLYHDVPLTGIESGERVSFNIWGALLRITDGTMHSMSAQASWRNGTTQVGLVDLGTVTDSDGFNGHVFGAASLARPATADNVRVSIITEVTWTATSIFQAFADAAAVTVP